MTRERDREAGVFVSIDGPGGAGKTTLVRHLHRWLADRGHAVQATTEPSHGPLGELARHGSDTYHGHALACLVAADRYHHLATEIRPALWTGHVVLSDRYVASSYVLQRLDGVPIEFIEAVNADVDRPDLAVLLTADPVVTTQRIATRGVHSRFETDLDIHHREADLYHDTAARLAAAGYPIVTVDTSSQCPQRVTEQVGRRIELLTRRTGQSPTA